MEVDARHGIIRANSTSASISMFLESKWRVFRRGEVIKGRYCEYAIRILL